MDAPGGRIFFLPNRLGDFVNKAQVQNIAAVDTNILIYAYDVSAGAKHARAADLMTEDYNHGQVVGGITVRNPFL